MGDFPAREVLHMERRGLRGYKDAGLLRKRGRGIVI